MFTLRTFALLACLTLAGCVAPAVTEQAEQTRISPADVEQLGSWGGASHVARLRHLYFSDQPDLEALRLAREQGVRAVINLRAADEEGQPNDDDVHALGLAYYRVPVSRQGDSFDAESMARIERIVADLGGDKVLLHCSTGNRATSWLAIHLHEKHAIDIDESLAIAAAAGLTNEKLLARVRRFVEED